MKKEIQAHDEVFAAFRTILPIECTKVFVSTDGMVMKIRATSDRLAVQWLLLSMKLIREEGYPLTVEVEEWKDGGVIFDRWLVFEFIGALS